MKDKIRIVTVCLFMAVVSALNLMMPTRSFSESENRYLQLLPDFGIEEVFSGEYAEDFQDYSTDQFPFRDFWIRLKTATDLATLKKDNGRVYFGKEGFLFEVEPPYDMDSVSSNIDYILEFAELLEERNIDFHVALIPSKESVLEGFLPDYAPVPDESLISNILEENNDEDFQITYLAQAFEERDQEYIYYRTDHHWTIYGAYLAYTLLGEKLGYQPQGIESFETIQIAEDFLGTLYRKANLYLDEPDTINVFQNIKASITEIKIDGVSSGGELYFEEYLDSNDKYSYFLGGDHGLVDIRTTSESGKTLLVVKDSFSNSLVPLMTSHYSRIVMVDPRHIGGGVLDTVEEVDPDQVLLALNTENIAYSRSLGVIVR